MSFVIRVTGGVARDAQSGVEKLVTTLEKGEAAAEEMGAAVTRASRASSTGMAQAARDTERARDAMGRFVAGARASSSSMQQIAAATDRGAAGVARFVGASFRWQSALDGVAHSAERAVDGIARIGAPAAHGQLVASLGRVGMAFDGVTQAIQREQAMLDRINGPTRRYMADLQVLDSLLARNKISTAQYAEQVTRLNRELERGAAIPTQAQRSRAPGSGPATTAGAGGLVAGLGSAGQIAAGLGVAVGAREVLSMASSYQTLQNRMKVVAVEGESVEQTFEKIRGVASSTRSSIESTTIAYQRLRGATKEMGLSSGDLLRVTERINKAIVVSGASAAEAQGGMIQLAQGIASNRLGGEELRSVLENLPYVADILAQSLGVTRGKLRELGEQGKLTAAAVVGAFEKMGNKIDEDFGKTTPTLTQQWTMLRDELTVTIGKLFETIRLFDTLGGVLGNVSSVVGAVGDAMAGLGDLVDHFGGGQGGTGISVVGKIVEYGTNPFAAVRDVAGLAKDGIDALSDSMNAHELAVARASQAYIAQVEVMRKLLAEEERLEKAASTLDSARAAGISVPGFDLEAAKAQLALASTLSQAFGTKVPASFDAATKRALELDTAIAKIRDKRALAEQDRQAKNFAKTLDGVNDILDEQAKRLTEASAKVAEYDAALAKRQELRTTVGDVPISRTDVEVVRGRRNALIELDAAENRYGATVARAKLATLEHRDALEDAHGAYRTGQLTLSQYRDELRRLGVQEDRATKLLKEMRQPAIDWGGTISSLNLLLRRGAIDLQQYNDGLARLAASQPTRSGEVRRGGEGLLGGRKIGGEEFAVSYDEEGRRAKFLDDPASVTRNLDTGAYEKLIESARVAGGVLEDAGAKTARWKQELEALQATAQQDGLLRGLEKIRAEVTDVAGALENALVNAFHGAEEALVSFVTTGEFSLKRFVNNALADMTRLMLRQAMAGLIGSFGGGGISSVFAGTGATQAFSGLYGSAPGFAHGGTMRVDGRPGIDTNLVAMRVSNGETITVTPPGRGGSDGGGAAPAPKVTVVNVYDRSEMRRYMEEEGEGFVLNALRRNEPAIRGRTTGR